MFLAFFIVFIGSIMYLWTRAGWWDSVAASAAEIGVMFCTLVLITGPIWARPIWGAWWSWDPTLTLTLVLWLIYIAYLMLHADGEDPKRGRFAAVLGIIGFVDVPIIRWSVEKWRTLHPKPVIVQEGGTTGLPPSMLLTFLICLAAFWLLFFFLVRERIVLAQSRQELDLLRHELDTGLSR
jgi:heme exporter protein C